MTQIFDPETGGVTPVTVIEAGPCPVVQVKTSDTDGYDAVQLAFEPSPTARSRRPSSATSPRRARPRTGTSSSSAARPS